MERRTRRLPEGKFVDHFVTTILSFFQNVVIFSVLLHVYIHYPRRLIVLTYVVAHLIYVTTKYATVQIAIDVPDICTSQKYQKQKQKNNKHIITLIAIWQKIAQDRQMWKQHAEAFKQSWDTTTAQ